jgi:hypothetical protein
MEATMRIRRIFFVACWMAREGSVNRKSLIEQNRIIDAVVTRTVLPSFV